MGETIFGLDGGNQLKVEWSQTYDVSTRKSTVAVTGLYVRRAIATSAWYYFNATVTLRDANAAAEASVVAALSYSPANNRVSGPNETWKLITQYQDGFTLGSIEAAHTTAGDASIELGISRVFYYTGSSGNFLSAQTAIEALENHPSGLVRIDTGTAFALAVPYIDTGSEWVRATPYVDDGAAWRICG